MSSDHAWCVIQLYRDGGNIKYTIDSHLLLKCHQISFAHNLFLNCHIVQFQRLTYWNRCYGREQQFATIKYNMGFDWISFIWTTPGRLTYSALTSSVTICSASHFVSRNSIAAQNKTNFSCSHYDDVIMIALASQITSLTVVYSIVNSGVDERKHQSSASLAFVRGIHRDRWIPRTKGQLRGKCLHLMTSSCGGREHQISTSADTLCNFG